MAFDCGAAEQPDDYFAGSADRAGIDEDARQFEAGAGDGFGVGQHGCGRGGSGGDIVAGVGFGGGAGRIGDAAGCVGCQFKILYDNSWYLFK